MLEVTLFLSLIKHHAMKVYVEVEE